MQHLLLALLVGGIGAMTFTAAIVGLVQEYRRNRVEVALEEAPSSIGRISERMDVPGKYPALRTRHSRTQP